MQVRLELAQNKANVKRVLLRQDAVIGRSAECNLRIASSLVSRQHCRIRVSETAVFLEDLDSSNGTFLNGTRLPPRTEVAVPVTGQLSVGGVKFVIRLEGAALHGPGSTVDLPKQTAQAAGPEVLTAEWSAQVAESARKGPASAAETVGAAASLATEAAPLPVVATSPAAEVIVPADPIEDDIAGYDLELNEPPAVEPLLVSPEEASSEMIDASAGDEIDTVMPEAPAVAVEPVGELPAFGDSEQEPAIEFPDFSAASESTGDSPVSEIPLADETESPKKKGGLKSLFGMLGRGKKGSASEEAATLPVAEAVAVAPEEAQPAVDAKSPAAKASPAKKPSAATAVAAPPAAVSDDDVMGFLGAEAEVEDDAESKPQDENLGDFLKSLGG